MKNILQKLGTLALFSGALLLAGCDPEIDEMNIANGGVDFTKYVAVGNSLTAGYSDGGLYREGQLGSYPNILAGQFAQVGGGNFIQPLFTEAQRNGSGYLRLRDFTATGSPITVNITTELGVRSPSPVLYTKFTDPINNLGVPGIRLSDIKTAGYGSTQGNPFFERITPDATPLQTYLQRVAASNPTFFSNWLGNNDVLGYATAGAFSNTLTDQTTFANLYTELTTTLTANNAKGIVATIPDVTGIPFFTTVGPQLKASLTAAGAPAFIALTGKGSTRVIVPTATIKDANGGTVLFTLTAAAYAPLFGRGSGQGGGKYWRDLAKQAFPTDAAPVAIAKVLLGYQIDTTQAFGASTGNPWPSALLLDNTEISEINTATVGFNNTIKAQAAAKGLAVFDAYTYFNSIQSGFSLNGVNYSPAFITGNLFSLDGVHPTPRGYAIVANEMIKAINAKYGSTIPTADVTKYRAVLFPQ